MSKTLLIIGHDNLENSFFNNKLLETAKNIKNLSIHKISFDLNIEKEQKLLLEHNNIVFQFPFYWYSFPAVLKNYIDQVFTRGFAHGYGLKTQLDNKNVHLIITAGGPENSYAPGQYNRYTIEDLLKPIENIFVVCKMNFHKPLFIFSAHQAEHGISEHDFNNKINDYKALLNKLA